MNPTQERLITILREGLRIDPAVSIGPDTLIFGKQGLGLDSVDVLEIAVLLDKNFGVMIEENDAKVHQALHTIGTLASYVDERLKGPSTGQL